MVPDDLIRDGIHEIGVNAFAVMTMLLSHSDRWETSAADMTARLRWGKNRQRCADALARLEKAGLLVIRDCLNEAGHRVTQEYIFNADARRFSDAEIDEWSRPVVHARSGCAETPGSGSGGSAATDSSPSAGAE